MIFHVPSVQAILMHIVHRVHKQTPAPTNTNTTVIIVNGKEQSIGKYETKLLNNRTQAIFEVQTPTALYLLPARQFNDGALLLTV